jgi:hypothetical protein
MAEPPAISIVGAAPAWTRADRIGPAPWIAGREVTFSPNGDHVRDHAVADACVAFGVLPELDVFHRFHRRELTRMSAARPGPTLHRQRALGCPRGTAGWRASWNGSMGLDPDGPHAQGSYWLTICARSVRGVSLATPRSPFTTRCARHPVLVRLQSVWLTLRWTRTSIAGATLRPRIATDARTVALELDDALGTPIRRLAAVAPSRAAITLPRTLAAGMYRIRVRAGSTTVEAPLGVRDLTPLDAPGDGTALVVLPSMTWLAYDRADVDRDGSADSWYATGPAFPSRGVWTDAPLLTDRPDSAEEDHLLWRSFFDWARPHRIQVVTDVELAAMSDATVARYAALVFPGHTEYYTSQLWNRVQGFRARGGDVMFLSSNSFYRRVELDLRAHRERPAWDRSAACVCTRDPAHSDMAMAGTGFIELDVDAHVPLQVAPGAIDAAPWLFAGTGLRTGDPLGYGVLELDAPAPEPSPAGTTRTSILSGEDAEGRPTAAVLTHEASGAWTFSSGNMAFANLVDDPLVPDVQRAQLRQLLANLWSGLVG